MLINLVKKSLQFVIQIFFSICFSIFGKPKFSRELKKTISLYKTGDFSETFTMIRAWDAPFEEIEKITPKSGKIVDLGCGDGLLANFLALASNKRVMFGFEINKQRVKLAQKGLKNTHFKHGSILSTNLPTSSSFLLIDVLHHLPSYEFQEKLLKSVHEKLSKSGKLIIAEVVERPFWKYVFSWLTDFITVPILFEGTLFSEKFYYRKTSDWISLLEKMGFKVKPIKADHLKPFSHILFECTK